MVFPLTVEQTTHSANTQSDCANNEEQCNPKTMSKVCRTSNSGQWWAGLSDIQGKVNCIRLNPPE